MIEAESVHQLFRGSAELSKTYRSVAFVCEFLAAAIALQGILTSVTLIAWRPFIVLLLLVISVAARLVAERYASFAEQCRRLSIRAYAKGEDLPVRTSSLLRNDAPWSASRRARTLPASKLDDYYEPRFPVGEARLRELYAYSAFYTSRLLRATKWLYALASVVLLVGSATVLVALLTSETEASRREAMLEVLFPVVLGIIALRCIEVFVACLTSETMTRSIADALIDDPLPRDEKLLDLVQEYDFGRVGAPAPPTLLYRLWRKALDAEWSHRRGALGEP